METISTRGRNLIRSRVGAAIRAAIKAEGRAAVGVKFGVADGTTRAWEAGTDPSYMACLRYMPILGLDAKTGERAS